MRRPLAALALVVVFAFSASARADDQAELDKGRNAYRGRAYVEAEKRFREMLDPQTGTIHDPNIMTQAYMYWGATELALNKKGDAEHIFELILRRDQRYEPDPLAFPVAVLDTFTDTRERIKHELDAQAAEAQRRAEEKRHREEAARAREEARVALLEKMAAEQPITEHHSRWIAFVPFGAGQFQNGEKALGWFFAGSESAFAVTAGVAEVVSLAKESQAQDIYRNNPTVSNPAVTANANEARNTAVTWRWVNLGFAGAFVATAVAGIIQANAKFQPEVTFVQKRAIPQRDAARLDWHLDIAPAVGDRPGGTVGVSGRF